MPHPLGLTQSPELTTTEQATEAQHQTSVSLELTERPLPHTESRTPHQLGGYTGMKYILPLQLQARHTPTPTT